MSTIPIFGTWKLSREQTAGTICDAITQGYRHIDTAAAYANEAEVGEGISQSHVARDTLFVSGKLWNTKRSYDGAIKACKKSLKNMGMDYFDQYLIHWPATANTQPDWENINRETWRGMETLRQEGIARIIGVCNYTSEHLEALLQTANCRPAVNQVEMHPGYAQKELTLFCNNEGIRIEAWSPLGNGKLLANELVCALSEKYACTQAQLCLRWCLQRGSVPISKASSIQHMQENLQISSFVISDTDMALLTEMDTFAFSGMSPDMPLVLVNSKEKNHVNRRI